MDVIPYLAAVSALAGLALAFFYYKAVEKESPGNERMVFLMEEIQKGAKAFLKKEYQWVVGLRRRHGDPARRRHRTRSPRSPTSSARSCRRSPATPA